MKRILFIMMIMLMGAIPLVTSYTVHHSYAVPEYGAKKVYWYTDGNKRYYDPCDDSECYVVHPIILTNSEYSYQAYRSHMPTRYTYNSIDYYGRPASHRTTYYPRNYNRGYHGSYYNYVHYQDDVLFRGGDQGWNRYY